MPRLTQSGLDLIWRLHGEGHSMSAIGDEVGVSKTAVHLAIRAGRRLVSMPARPPRREPGPRAALRPAKREDARRSPPVAAPSRRQLQEGSQRAQSDRRTKAALARDPDVARLRRMGWSVTAIARYLGRDEAQVAYVLGVTWGRVA